MTSIQLLQMIQQELNEQGYKTKHPIPPSVVITNPQNNQTVIIWIWSDSPDEIEVYDPIPPDINLTINRIRIGITEPNAITQLFNEIQERIGQPTPTY